MSMVKTIFMETEDNLSDAFNSVDSAFHDIKKINDHGLYISKDLNKAFELIREAHSILDDEQQVFADIVSGE